MGDRIEAGITESKSTDWILQRAPTSIYHGSYALLTVLGVRIRAGPCAFRTGPLAGWLPKDIILISRADSRLGAAMNPHIGIAN